MARRSVVSGQRLGRVTPRHKSHPQVMARRSVVSGQRLGRVTPRHKSHPQGVSCVRPEVR